MSIKKRRKLSITKLILVFAMFAFTCFTGCGQQSDRVSYNLSKEADNFNIIRKITVINCIQGDVLFQMTGRMSIEADCNDNQLEIVVEVEKDHFKKHFIGLSDNVTYVLEDISGKNVNKYAYTINFNPKMWLPVDVDTVD